MRKSYAYPVAKRIAQLLDQQIGCIHAHAHEDSSSYASETTDITTIIDNEKYLITVTWAGDPKDRRWNTGKWAFLNDEH